MISFDSLTLKAFTEESRNFLTGARIQKIQQPSRKEIILTIRNNSVTKKLYININPNSAHICFMSKENEEKRYISIPQKPPMFCMLLRKYIENAKISKINQPQYERILEFYIETFNELSEKIYLCLAIEIMGKHSNIVLYNYDTNIIIGCAHNVGAEKSREREMSGTLPYTYPPRQHKRDIVNYYGNVDYTTLSENFYWFSHYFAEQCTGQSLDKLKDFINKLENTYYDELKELIENKDSIISEYKKSKSNKLELKDNEKYKPKDKVELLKLIKEKVKFNKIDTSLITDMSGLFQNSKLKKFDGIETWDTSNVEDMHNMFRGALHFNHNINNWNVSKVINMEHMFSGCEFFNQPLNNWDVSNVKYMAFMFSDCSSFDNDLSNWNVSNVESMEYMFENAYSFNQDISKWNISKVKKLSSMFSDAKSFNQPLNDWNMSNIESIHGMFKGASNFNQPLDKWNTSNIKDISFAFAYCINFNQDLESWKLGENINMKYAFIDSPIENHPPSWYEN